MRFVAGFVVISITLSIATSEQPIILTPFITQGRIQEAKNLSLVDPQYFLGVQSYSGFLTVDAKHDSNTFFWYFPINGQRLNDTPWLIWLQGGPGGSSLTGVFDEIGPFEYVNGSLKERPSSWCKNFSMLFIDNPIGAGYSFTRSPDGYAKSMAMYSEHLYTALQQFLTLFPELRGAPLYLAGESYAGHYVPAFADLIHAKAMGNESVNLQGLILGNPVLDRSSIANYTSVFYNWGLVSEEAVAALQPLEKEYAVAIGNLNYTAASKYREELINRLLDIAHQSQRYNLLQNSLSFNGYVEYLSRADVTKALHVGNETFNFVNNDVGNYLEIKEFFANMTPVVTRLLEDYRLLIYCGQLDLVSPCVPNEHAHRNWKWSHQNDFLSAQRKAWLDKDGNVAGYIKSGGNFTEVLIRGSGHLAPIDKPQQVLNLVTNFIRNQTFPTSDAKLPNIPDNPIETSFIDNASRYKALFVTSLVANAVLICAIFVVVIYCKRLRRMEGWHFTAVDDFDDHSDGILSLS